MQFTNENSLAITKLPVLQGNLSLLANLNPVLNSHIVRMNLVKLIVLALAATLGSVGCVVPGSKVAVISIAAEVVDQTQRPLPNTELEVMLPAEYGLNEIDLDFGDAQSFGHDKQVVKLVTDQLGTASHRFEPVTVSTVFWLLPPLGGFPRQPPEPFFLLRFKEQPDSVYSVLVQKDGAIFTPYQRTATGEVLAKKNSARFTLEGSLIDDRGPEDRQAWIAKLKFQRIPESRITATAPGLK